MPIWGSPVEVDLTVEAALMGAIFDLSWPAAPGVDGFFATGAFDAAFAMGGFDGNEPSESMSQEKF
jgi:hypothetical protein